MLARLLRRRRPVSPTTHVVRLLRGDEVLCDYTTSTVPRADLPALADRLASAAGPDVRYELYAADGGGYPLDE